MSQHTATPWRCDDAPGRVLSGTDFVASTCWHTDDEIDPDDTERANAEFIVRACNAHGELVAACKAARNVLCSMHNSMPMHVCTVDCPDIRKYVDQLDAAIAKATT